MRPLLGLLGTLTLAAWLLLTPYAARGHATLVRSEPPENAFLQRAPANVSLTFSEPVEGSASTVRVLDASGRPIQDAAPIQVAPNGLSVTVALPNLRPGIYNVLWTNVSRVDGHALRGSYPFTVLNADGSLPDEVNQVAGLGSDPDPPPLPKGVAVRALSLLGLCLAAAAALLLLLLPGPGSGRGLPRLLVLGALVSGLALLLNLALIRETYPGRGAITLFETNAGVYWLVRLGGTAVVGVAAALAFRFRRTAAVVAMEGLLAYLWGYTATSHAAAGTGANWAMAIDFIHASAAVGWIGAVTGLAVTTRIQGRHAPYRALMPRFALLASSMVFLLLGTGLFNALIEFNEFSRLWTTGYGVTLLVKLGLLLPLLLLALYNARIGRRRLVSGATGEPRRFIATAMGEAFLGLLVILAAAWMSQTTTAKGVYDRPDDRPFDATTTSGDLSMRLQIDPNRTGLNTYRATLAAGGAPIGTAERVRLTFRYLDDPTVGTSALNLAPADVAGAYVGQGPFLTFEGQWRVEVEVRRTDKDDAVAFFDVRPAGSAAATLRRGGAWENPAPGLRTNTFAGMVIAFLALGIAVFKDRIPRPRERTRERAYTWSANIVVLLGFGFGSLLLFGVHNDQAAVRVQKNPIFPDRNSIEQGRQIYQTNCITCHGLRGVPPQGLNLSPYPLDLTVHVPLHADGVIFNFIANGVPGSAMRAWSEDPGGLTSDQMWHVVNYLRTLGTVDR